MGEGIFSNGRMLSLDKNFYVFECTKTRKITNSFFIYKNPFEYTFVMIYSSKIMKFSARFRSIIDSYDKVLRHQFKNKWNFLIRSAAMCKEYAH